MGKAKEIAVLYSGGSDSTCCAALMAKEFDRLHLLTYKRFGIFSTENSFINVRKLREKFGQEKFLHSVFNVDKLFKEISYSRYYYYLRKYGFFLLTCGPCKLTLHLRSLIYCLDKHMEYACDGANKNIMGIFPDQMQEVVGELEKLYSFYGIKYITPVFNFDYPGNIEWSDKLGLKELFPSNTLNSKDANGMTTGKALFQMDILPTENIKGTKFDQRMQIRCFQFILSHIFANGYYVPRYGLNKFKEVFIRFYKEKISDSRKLIDEYLKKKEKSRLYRLIH